VCQRAGNINVDLPQATVTVVPIRATLASLSSTHRPEGTPSPTTDLFFWSDSPHFLNSMSCPVLPLWLCSHTCLVAVFLPRPFFPSSFSVPLSPCILSYNSRPWCGYPLRLPFPHASFKPTTHTSGAQRDIRISDLKL
jgi:hypothetical protein